MKNVTSIINGLILFFTFSSFMPSDIPTKSGNIEIPAKGEIRMWKGIKHGSFDVEITNVNPTQSVELYTVKSNGTEKWVSPSLLANSSLTVRIPADGHLFIKNFNPNKFTISYQIK